MKIGPQQAGAVLRDPAALAGILLFGDDWGLIRDRSAAATKAVIGPTPDPFRQTVLTKDEHKQLREAVMSLSLGGGRRVVRVQDASDTLAAVLEPLAMHRSDALVILECGALTPRSKLRVFAERHAQWASIGCYSEGTRNVTAEITRVLAEAGLTIEQDALAYLTAELTGESNRRRAELEKLVVYGAGDRVITLQAAQACCSVGMDASLGEAVSAALAGRVRLADRLVEELSRDGATGAGLLAVLSNQVQRVMKVRLHMHAGAAPEEACRRLQPPVFPQQIPGFLEEVRCWPLPALEGLARAIRDADIACKRASSPDLAIAARLLNAIATRAQAGGRPNLASK